MPGIHTSLGPTYDFKWAAQIPYYLRIEISCLMPSIKSIRNALCQVGSVTANL